MFHDLIDFILDPPILRGPWAKSLKSWAQKAVIGLNLIDTDLPLKYVNIP
jgi:hypothetical protein